MWRHNEELAEVSKSAFRSIDDLQRDFHMKGWKNPVAGSLRPLTELRREFEERKELAAGLRGLAPRMRSLAELEQEHIEKKVKRGERLPAYARHELLLALLAMGKRKSVSGTGLRAVPLPVVKAGSATRPKGVDRRLVANPKLDDEALLAQMEARIDRESNADAKNNETFGRRNFSLASSQAAVDPLAPENDIARGSQQEEELYWIWEGGLPAAQAAAAAQAAQADPKYQWCGEPWACEDPSLLWEHGAGALVGHEDFYTSDMMFEACSWWQQEAFSPIESEMIQEAATEEFAEGKMEVKSIDSSAAAGSCGKEASSSSTSASAEALPGVKQYEEEAEGAPSTAAPSRCPGTPTSGGSTAGECEVARALFLVDPTSNAKLGLA